MATQNIRPDLAMVDIQQLTGLIGNRVLPVLNRPVKIGNQYYVTVDNDVSAQTGRVLGVAPTAVTLASQSGTFSAAEAIKRTVIPDDEIRLMGGLANAQMKAARIGKRSILRAREDAIVTALATTTQTADILGSLRQALDTAVDAIQRVPGRLVLACGWTTFRRISRYSEITDTLLRTGVVAQSALAVRNVDAPTVASVLGVDEILIGDDDHWAAGTAYLLRAPDPNMEPDETPQIGRVIQYLPEDGMEFEMRAWYEDTILAEVVDARTWYIAKMYNPSGVYKLTGIDEGNIVTTTTTTT
jgi:hypothetical protein